MVPRMDSTPIAERPETWGPELSEDPIEASQCCSALKFASALSDPERSVGGILTAASPQRFPHLATTFRRNSGSLETSASSVPAHVVDTMHEVAPEPSSSSGIRCGFREEQAEEPRHKTLRTARKSKGACESLVLEQFFPVRKRICLDRDDKSSVLDDHIAETKFSTSPVRAVAALSNCSNAFERSVQKSDGGPSGQDVKWQEVFHDHLSTHDELSFVEVGCHVDVKAKVDKVGNLQIQELPLQPGESTASRNLTLRFQDGYFCEWRLWGDDAEKHGDVLLSQEVTVMGAKLYKFNGKISLNGCTSVVALQHIGHTTARTDINSCLSVCKGAKRVS